MRTKTLAKLDEKKFQEIYSNEDLRNKVAFAHGCADKNGNHLYFKTCDFPNEFIVTEEQITLANIELAEAKKRAKEELKNKLVFVGMGSTYPARYENDVCNHRMRSEFINKFGNKFFLEVGTQGEALMRVDFAIDRTKQEKLKADVRKQSEFYNYKGLERNNPTPVKYTLQNVLKFVNANFDCAFTEIEVDNFTLSPEDFICKSPK